MKDQKKKKFHSCIANLYFHISCGFFISIAGTKSPKVIHDVSTSERHESMDTYANAASAPYRKFEQNAKRCALDCIVFLKYSLYIFINEISC